MDIITKMDRGGLDCGPLYDIFRHIDVELIIDIYTSMTDAIRNGDTNLEASVCSLILMRRAISSAIVSLLRTEAAEATG